MQLHTKLTSCALIVFTHFLLPPWLQAKALHRNLINTQSSSTPSISQFSNRNTNYLQHESFEKLYAMTPTNSAREFSTEQSVIPIIPCGDELDKRIAVLVLPGIINFLIVPLVGSVDTFWVGRMRDVQSLAGQGAANQLFTSAFWFFSFLPSVITPLIAKAIGEGNQEAVLDRVGEAIFIATTVGSLGMLFLALNSAWALNLVVRQGAEVRKFAEPYLFIRALTFVPALLSTVGFAVLRGTQDVFTPLKISLVSNLLNIVLDPILIFRFGLGVSGAAWATCAAEIVSFALYAQTLVKKKLLRVNHLLRIPSFTAMKPLLLGGASMQVRSIALNTAILAVSRAAQHMDPTGGAAAAHAVSTQLFQLGSVASLALSVVASVVIPTETAKAKRENSPSGLLPVRQVADRLMAWGAIIGTLLAIFQLLSLPLIGIYSPLADVQEMARGPALVGAFLQLLNCLVWTGEGIQQGNQDFASLVYSTAAGTAGMLFALKFAGNSLTKVWSAYVVMAVMRLLGVVRHLYFAGPLAKSKLQKISKEN